MPLHDDFAKMKAQFIKKYGSKKGEEFFYRYKNKHKLDDTKPMPKHLSANVDIENGVGGFGGNGKELVFAAASKPTIKLDTVDGKKVALISGTLMNNKFNANDWRMPLEVEGETHASRLNNGLPLKIKHGNDYTICGKSTTGSYDSSTGELNYNTIVRGAEEVKKFEDGTWDVDTIGVSPKALLWERLECSICNDDLRECPHEFRSVYNGKKCQATIHGSHLTEHSLTSEPAYLTTGAGNITNVLIAAIGDGKMEENEIIELQAKIKEKDDLIIEKDRVLAEKDGMIAEKEGKIKELSAKVDTKDLGEANMKDVTKELEDMKVEIKRKDDEFAIVSEKLNGYVKAERQDRLEKVFDKEKNKEVIATILNRNYSDEEFVARITELEAVKGFSASNETRGSLPTDTNDKNKSFEDSWGSPIEAVLAEIVGNSDSHVIGINGGKKGAS